VAHEAAHQWWGNIVTPGKGPGGNVISEGLAEFSACMLMHHELSPDQAKVLRRRWEWTYVTGALTAHGPATRWSPTNAPESCSGCCEA